MTAPTEQEIRAELNRRVTDYPHDDPREPLKEAIDAWASILTSPAYDILESPDPRDEGDDSTELWADLRPSEAIVLRRLATEAIDRVFERCQELVTEEVVAAALAFAAEHPDAPRPQREPVPA